MALASGTWRWTLRNFPAYIDLPMGPVTAVDSVTYSDADGMVQTYLTARLADGRILPAASGSWPTAYDSVTVEFTAGLASPDEAPELVAAAKLLLGHLYENREAVSGQTVNEVPLAFDSLVQTYRKVLV